MTDYAAAYYGPNYPKLQEVKKKWDPLDYFHVPQGIRLPGDDDGIGGGGGGDANNLPAELHWTNLAHRQRENPSRAGLSPPRDDFPDVIRNLADLKF